MKKRFTRRTATIIERALHDGGRILLKEEAILMYNKIASHHLSAQLGDCSTLSRQHDLRAARGARGLQSCEVDARSHRTACGVGSIPLDPPCASGAHLIEERGHQAACDVIYIQSNPIGRRKREDEACDAADGIRHRPDCQQSRGPVRRISGISIARRVPPPPARGERSCGSGSRPPAGRR